MRVLVAVAAFFLVAAEAGACPVCFGDPESPMIDGTNNAIAILLGVIVLVQIGFAALFWNFWRRARDIRERRERLHLIEGGAR